MKANELRIRNIFQTQIGDILEVETISTDKIEFKVVDRSKFPLLYKWQAQPIPLTEEWLLKLGFQRTIDTTNYDWVKNGVNICCNEITGRYYEYYTYANCDYVHQLQNLFFSLCGEELQINT